MPCHLNRGVQAGTGERQAVRIGPEDRAAPGDEGEQAGSESMPTASAP